MTNIRLRCYLAILRGQGQASGEAMGEGQGRAIRKI